MKKRLAFITILLTMASSHIVFAVSGVVNASSLNIRQNPSLSSYIMGFLPRDTSVNTLGKSGSFYKIIYKGKTGYVYSSYIKIRQATSSAAVVNVTGVGHISAWDLNVRKTPSTGNNVIGSLNPTSSINLYGIQDNYYRIKYSNNWAYIAKSYVKSGTTSTTTTASTSSVASISTQSSGTSKLSSLMLNAYRLLGIQYTWGGSSPSTGFDCSGLAQYIYKTIGVTLPRTTYDMIGSGTEVSINNLQPGDLIFFATDPSSSSPSHMGIYIGNNKFIQSPKTGDVVNISDFNEYFRSVFITGRRIL